jgi:hypothetical protein
MLKKTNAERPKQDGFSKHKLGRNTGQGTENENKFQHK